MKHKSRRFFIGDIHGCLDELNDLLDNFQFHLQKDQLFSVGDVIGKGPYGPDTLKRLKTLKATIVLGNHDDAFLRYEKRPGTSLKPDQKKFLDSFGNQKNKWAAEVRSWPLFIEMDDIIMVHAGLEPGVKDLSNMSSEILLNIRTWDGSGKDIESEHNSPWYSFINSEKTIIFGHWARKGLINLPKFKGLDTGCVYGMQLTGYCPEEDRFYSVESRKAYEQIKNDE